MKSFCNGIPASICSWNYSRNRLFSVHCSLKENRQFYWCWFSLIAKWKCKVFLWLNIEQPTLVYSFHRNSRCFAKLTGFSFMLFEFLVYFFWICRQHQYNTDNEFARSSFISIICCVVRNRFLFETGINKQFKCFDTKATGCMGADSVHRCNPLKINSVTRNFKVIKLWEKMSMKLVESAIWFCTWIHKNSIEIVISKYVRVLTSLLLKWFCWFRFAKRWFL